MVDILIEFGLGITRLFINPLFYIAIAMSVYLGYRRVKRERRNFHIRILSGWSELSGLFKEGLLLSLSISIAFFSHWFNCSYSVAFHGDNY